MAQSTDFDSLCLKYSITKPYDWLGSITEWKVLEGALEELRVSKVDQADFNVLWSTHPMRKQGAAGSSAAGSSAATHAALRHCASFHLGKTKSKPVHFSSYDEMLTFLHGQWPALKAKHDLVVGHKGPTLKHIRVVDESTLQELFRLIGTSPDVHLHVDMRSRGFSWYAKHHDAALEKVHSSAMRESEFDLDDTIVDAKYDAAAELVCAELLRRVRVLDLEQSSEYTMRELISPVLVGALCLVDDNNGKRNETKVRLICEKLISGTSGHGPVDYVLSYLNVYIVIGEAKHKELLEGLYQNLVQQCNALESLADKVLGSAVVGDKRSRDFIGTFAGLRGMGTCGITSTGKEWMFSRTERDPADTSKIIIHKSQAYALTVSSTATDPTELAALRTQVRVLLRRIVHMIFTQKAAVDGHPGLKDITLQTRIDAEEIATQEMAREVLELDDEDGAQDENGNA